MSDRTYNTSVILFPISIIANVTFTLMSWWQEHTIWFITGWYIEWVALILAIVLFSLAQVKKFLKGETVLG